MAAVMMVVFLSLGIFSPVVKFHHPTCHKRRNNTKAIADIHQQLMKVMRHDDGNPTAQQQVLPALASRKQSGIDNFANG
jgi:hypothetical protein